MGSAKDRGTDGVDHGGRPRSFTEKHLLVRRELVAEHLRVHGAAHRREHNGLDYSCCLTDTEWTRVADLFEHPAGGRGMPPRLDRHTLADACCYVLRTGCAWRLLPKRSTVYKSFSRWPAQGAFEAMQIDGASSGAGVSGVTPSPAQRCCAGCAVHARIAARRRKRFDGAKKVKGCKRHMLVDTMGLLLAVGVTDRDGATDVVAQACAKLPSICHQSRLCSLTAPTAASARWRCTRRTGSMFR